MAISIPSGSMMRQSGPVAEPGATNAVAGGFKRANARIEQQVGSTRVQLSAYGQMKSAFADVQAAGKALTELKQTATVTDVKKAVQGFADAYNRTNRTVADTTRGGKNAGPLANDGRARIAATDLRRMVGEGDNPAELRKLGITRNQNGELAVDTRALENALQANPDQVKETLSRIGQQVDRVATRELGETGNVGKSMSTLNSRAQQLESRQTAQQELAAAAQQSVLQETTRMNNALAGGLDSYQRIFSG